MQKLESARQRPLRSSSGLANIDILENRLLFTTTAGRLEPIDHRYIGKTLPPAATTAKGTTPAKNSKTKAQASATPAAAATAPFTPVQLRHFYGADSINFAGVAGTGAKQTIVLIDYNNQPNIKSDLTTFDNQFGIAAPPSFIVESQTGSTTSLPTSYDSDDALEISLDVEYAHSMAPAANIILIETSFSYSTNPSFINQYIADGVGEANSISGVSVVSMSYGVAEFSTETSDDSYFTHTGITYVASAGDNGSANTVYPSFSPNVVSVGGTQITTSDANASYGSEVVWNDTSDGDGATGGAISKYEAKPSYQSAVTQSSTKRTTPDVSLEASPDTGVYVYDSSQSSPGFYDVGGTSLSAPCWAGLIAIADQGRVNAGGTTLSGSTQTLPALYKLPTTDFHDITSTNNNYENSGGYSAGMGYDLASGLGTPVAPTLVPDLAGLATVTGRVFQDNNSDGVYDGADVSLTGLTVYLDINNDGVEESGEPTAVTDANGLFTFTGVTPGVTGAVRLVTVPAGYVQVATATYSGTAVTTSTANIALFPNAYTDFTANDIYTLNVNATDTTDQILINGTLTYSAPVALPPSFSFSLTGSGDSLVVDGTNGNPVPTGGVALTGAASGDILTVNGTTSSVDAFVVTSSSISFDGNPITFSNVTSLLLNPGGGTDSLAVNSGTVTIAAKPGAGIVQRIFSSVSLAAGASALFATAPSHSDRALAIVSSLSIAAGARLDLGGNDMDVKGGTVSTLFSQLSSGFNGGQWNGPGIDSAMASADTTHRMAIGMLANTLGVYGNARKFDLYAPATNDVLLKYTYYGDANLDGHVDGSDYSVIDAAILPGSSATGWSNGDFNYDGHVNSSDYALIDTAYNTQGASV